MNVLVPGHTYTLDSFEGGEPQTLQFIHKELNHPTEGGAQGILHTVADGTTNEDVLAVLIDRMQFLQRAFPCRENALVITKLEEGLMWLNKRTADREARGVEGRQAA
jgi:hypothetical protein